MTTPDKTPTQRVDEAALVLRAAARITALRVRETRFRSIAEDFGGSSPEYDSAPAKLRALEDAGKKE